MKKENFHGTNVTKSIGRLCHSKMNHNPLLLAQAVQLVDVFCYHVSQQCWS